MRVTNNMIMRNSAYNINGTKGIVNNSMNQMTTQKKINKPSEDPVVAIRSLRLSTSLSRVDQYYKKNIPDAESWLDVTETALLNIKTLMTDIRTQCVNGATDTLTQDDRNTILSQLKALQEQVFSEGNADYAGRTVFTGFRTDQDLVFMDNENDREYDIDQRLSYENMESFRYYAGNMGVPATGPAILAGPNKKENMVETDYYRFQLAYKDIDDITKITYSYDSKDGAKEKTLSVANGSLRVFDNEEAWLAASMAAAGNPPVNTGKTIAGNQAVFIKSTGELILGNDIAAEIRNNKADIDFSYNKKGFTKGELKPEYYFNCTDNTNPQHKISYQKFDEEGKEIGYDINYTVAMSQELTVNLEASDAFNSDIQRNVDDLISAMDRAIKAHDKLDAIKAMKKEAQYSEKQYQDKFDDWIAAAQKEADYADDHVQKLYSTEITKVDGYLENINLAVAKVGCTVDQLKLTEMRMSNQQETIMELQSENDDLDISEIIINYTAAYNAYQSSLTAAGKLSGMTLLNYI